MPINHRPISQARLSPTYTSIRTITSIRVAVFTFPSTIPATLRAQTVSPAGASVGGVSHKGLRDISHTPRAVPLVRLLVADYLRRCGLRVIEAANADEAILVLEANEVLVDVVFADVNMPGDHDGFGLARWVRKNRPGIKVVLGSGMAATTEKAVALGHEGPIIAKPYDLPDLERRLRALLD